MKTRWKLTENYLTRINLFSSIILLLCYVMCILHPKKIAFFAHKRKQQSIGKKNERQAVRQKRWRRRGEYYKMITNLL